MRRIQYLFFVASILSANALALSQQEQSNPYHLTTEEALASNATKKINRFWDKEAKFSSFKGVDNIKINTVSIRNNNDKVIVVVQGRSESVLKYKELAFNFAKLGYDIYLIDHRGQGFSQRLGGDQFRGHVKNFQNYVTDLNTFITQLDLKDKYKFRYILSHSMGGAISALYLEQYQTPFQVAVFSSPMFSINFGSYPLFLAKIITYTSGKLCSWFSKTACYALGEGKYHPQNFKSNVLTSSPIRFANSQQGYSDFPETQLGGPTMWWISESISAMNTAINNANKITIPFLLLQSGNDQVVTSKGQDLFLSNAKTCKNNQFLLIKKAKHELFIEKDEYRIPALTAILNFFKKSEKGKMLCIK